LSKYRWKTSHTDKDAAAAVSEEFSLEPLAALLLASRGMTDSEAIENFLFADSHFRDPFEIEDMDRAVERIGAAVDSGEKIMIFGDYDADGVTSTTLLYLYLREQGADVGYYIPDRMSEGYGISCEAVREFSENGTKLIITVDNGISAVEETRLANELGMDVVITDHHKVGEAIPDAVAVVNPHRADSECEFREYAGVGVVFKLVCALEGDSDTICEKYADLAAIGTLADVVPVVDENRIIVKKGVEQLKHSHRYGIEALKAVSGTDKRAVTATSIAFGIAPRINAAGRMKSAKTAVELLLCDSAEKAQAVAQEIDTANRERQTVETETAMQAVELIESDDRIKYAPIIVVSGENWHQGVIGIVASRLVSRYGKPAIVISTDGETGKGSCRSVGGFSIYDALSSVSGMLNHFGGHTLAAGFGINSKDIDKFRLKLCEYAQSVSMPYPELGIDLTIKPSLISNQLLDVLSMFEPFGADNPQPCFAMKNAVLKSVRPVGEGKHLRLTFEKDSREIGAIMFSQTAKDFQYEMGDLVNIAFRVERNEFRGEVKPAVQIVDIAFADSDFDIYNASRRVYEKFRGGAELSEKELRLLTPDRAFFASVYKFLKAKNGFSYGMEAFCHRARCPYKYAAKVLVTLDVMEELGIIGREAENITLLPTSEKVDLASSVILKKLTQKEMSV
jgi:single-stranded-DNA-specific exonuclease